MNKINNQLLNEKLNELTNNIIESHSQKMKQILDETSKEFKDNDIQMVIKYFSQVNALTLISCTQMIKESIALISENISEDN